MPFLLVNVANCDLVNTEPLSDTIISGRLCGKQHPPLVIGAL